MKLYHCLHCGKENTWKHSTTNKFCDSVCHGDYRKAQWLLENTQKFEDGTLPTRAAIKKYVKIRDGNQCAICNQQPLHNGKELVMILDHIDGDASNNHPLNFRLVCPNCDTQLPTYKGANRGSGRATKGMKWFSSL